MITLSVQSVFKASSEHKAYMETDLQPTCQTITNHARWGNDYWSTTIVMKSRTAILLYQVLGDQSDGTCLAVLTVFHNFFEKSNIAFFKNKNMQITIITILYRIMIIPFLIESP